MWFVMQNSGVETVKPTIWRALQLWFAFAWRLIAYTIAGTLVVGLVLGAAFAVLQLDPGAQKTVISIATYVIGLPAALYAARRCLGRKIGDFQIMLVKAD